MSDTQKTQSKVKSLREGLLKSTAVNFDRIFLELDKDIGKVVLKKDIRLPPHLFEDIQDKSLEICWIIPHKSLTSCLSSREALNWINIKLTLTELTDDDLLNIEKSDFPIKQLTFQTYKLTDTMLNVIEKFASTIEILEIGSKFAYCCYDRCERRRKPYECDVIKFQKLRVLALDLDPIPSNLVHRFDLSSCSNSLRKLSLRIHPDRSVAFCNTTDTENDTKIKFFDSIKVLTQLESLALDCSGLTKLEGGIEHLKNLRTLFIRASDEVVPPRLLQILPKLENLALSHYCLINELSSLDDRTLKYAGTLSSGSGDVPENLKMLAMKFGSHHDLQSYINYLEFLRSFSVHARRDLTSAFEHMFSLIKTHSIPATKLRNIEMALLSLMKEYPRSNFCYMRNILKKYENHWTQDFLLKLSNFFVSSQLCEMIRLRYEYDFLFLVKLQPLQNFMKSYVAMNPDSSTTRLYSKIGISS